MYVPVMSVAEQFSYQWGNYSKAGVNRASITLLYVLFYYQVAACEYVVVVVVVGGAR